MSERRTCSIEAKLPVEPNFLLGRKVTVKWDDGKWYSGTAQGFDAETFEHKIAYEDGDEEQLIIGTTVPVKVFCSSKEQLPLPTPQQLEHLSSILLQLAEQDDAAAAKAAGPSERRKKQSEAERKRAKAQELWQLAEDTAVVAPQSCAAKPNAAAFTGILLQQHRHTADLPHGPSAMEPCSTGELSQALLAAQQLLKGMHPSHVPGLGFTRVAWPWQQVGPSLTTVEAQRQLDEQRQQQHRQHDASMGSDLLCLDQELASAFEVHQQTKQEHGQYYKELDVSLRMSPEGLVGRDVRVYWLLDDAWFLGTVDHYNPETAQHRVSYRDGTVEQYWLGTERVRLQHSPGEQLPPPDAERLAHLAQKYQEQAQLLDDERQQKQLVHASASGTCDTVAADEDAERPSLLRSKAQLLLAASHIKQHNQAPDNWVPPAAKSKAASGGSSRTGAAAAGGSEGARVAAAAAAAAAAAPEALGSAFPASHGEEQAQQHGKQQAQQQKQKWQPRQSSKRPSVEDVGHATVAACNTAHKRHKSSAGAEDTTAFAADMAADARDDAATDHSAQPTPAGPTVLQELQQHQPMAISTSKPKTFHRNKLSTGNKQQPEQPDTTGAEPRAPEQQAQQIGGQQQQDTQQAAEAAEHAANVGQLVDGSNQASKAGTGRSSNGSGGSNISAIEMYVLPGDVVWVQSKGQPPWPAIVISNEEATDWSIPIRMAKQPQVCVQYFGDYARARVHPSSLLPPCVAVDQRVWMPTLLSRTRHRLVDQYRLALRELIEYCKSGNLPDPEMVPEHHDDRWFESDDTAASNMDAMDIDATAAAQSTGSKLKKKSSAAAAAAAASGYPGSLKGISTMEKDLSSRLSKLGAKLGGPGSLTGSSSNTAADKVLKDLRDWAAQLVASHSAAAGSATIKAAKLPLQITGNLIVLSLGRVEFLHPGFHSEKFIYPVGLSVRRKARSPASCGGELWHTCEILEHPSGSGPLFRITPDGGQPASGSSPTAAWEQLDKSAASGATADTTAAAARAVGTCGAKLFGLQHPVVQALVQALPNAAACDKFVAWQGERPPPVQLTAELQLAKRAIATKLLSLPSGITPLPLSRRMVSACDACGDEIEVEGNLLVECDKCRVVVHMRCYGLNKPSDGSSWLCDVCRLPGLSGHPPCSLCPRLGGAMKVTADGGWCHLMCATWLPGMCVADAHKMEPIMGRVHKDHRSLLCSICKQPYGACIQCAGSGKCYAAFHPTCARDAGFAMVAVYDEDSDSEPDVPAAGDTAAGAASAGPLAASRQQQHAISGSKGLKAPRRPKKVRKEGTAAGDNTRLFCYCPKHKHKAAGLERSMVFETTINPGAGPPPVAPGSRQLCSGPGGSLQATGGCAGSGSAVGSAAAVTAAGGGQEVTSPRSAAAATIAPQGYQQATATAAPKVLGVSLFADFVAAGTSARSRPADTAVRRGLRAPDALAAALKKRQYVQPLPYLVTSSTQVGQLLPPPATRGRTTGREFQCNSSKPQHLQQYPEQSLLQQPSQQQDPGHVSSTASRLVTYAAAATSLGDKPGLQQQAQVAVVSSFAGCNTHCDLVSSSSEHCAHHMSLADRYQHMTATVLQRISSGKSAIHGLGVFAKVPHSTGDMVVEYIGHLVRPRVADLLEARTYNQLVGAGTYVFRLNDSFLVDATRAGNIAHLINHSCAPSCVSKTYTIQCPHTAERRDHVVIVAKRDIAVGEEFTYDYRFAGDERLRCNCGASICRGWVNTPSSFDSPMKRSDGSLLLPSRELVPINDLELSAASKPALAHGLF